MVTVALETVTLRFVSGPTALENVNVELRSGELAILAGANGAGKSALLRVAASILKPTAGSVSYTFSPEPQGRSPLRRLLRMVTQHPSRQLLGATVREELEISAAVAEVGTEELLEHAEAYGFGELLDRPVHALSGGEQRRLALAGALLGSPELLLFDEPFLELDYPSTREFLRTVVEARARGAGVIIATHDYHRVLAEADRMLILAAGHLEADGPPEDLLPRTGELGLRPPEAPLSELTWLKEQR